MIAGLIRGVVRDPEELEVALPIAGHVVEARNGLHPAQRSRHPRRLPWIVLELLLRDRAEDSEAGEGVEGEVRGARGAEGPRMHTNGREFGQPGL